jgi:hypothetical protein
VTRLRNKIAHFLKSSQAVAKAKNFKISISKLSGTASFKNVNNCLNTNIYSYLEASGDHIYNLYLNIVHFFSTPVLIRHMWQLKTVVFLHRCLIHAVLFESPKHLHPTTFETLKYLQQTMFGNVLFRPKFKKLHMQKVAQNVAIFLGDFFFTKNHSTCQR